MKRRCCFAAVLLLLTACAGRQPSTSVFHPDVLKGEAHYLVSGDIDAAERDFLRALEQRSDTRAAFMLGDLYDETGRPTLALAYYLKALESAYRTGDGSAAAVAAAMGTVALRDRVEGFHERFFEFMRRFDNRSGKLPPEAWFQLLNLKYGLLRNRGEIEAAEAAKKAIGCLTTWQSVGPIGPWVWTAFDAEHPELSVYPWPETVSLGPGRGTASKSERVAETCFVTLENPAVPLEGVTYARTVISRESAGRVGMRLQAKDAVTVHIGGEEVLRRDTRDAYLSNVQWITLELPEGETEIAVKLAATTSVPSFSLVMVADGGTPGYVESQPSLIPERRSVNIAVSENDGIPREAASKIDVYALMKISLWWDDMDAARGYVRELETDGATTAPMVMLNTAEMVAADPAMPGNLAYEQARPYLEEALALDSRLWQARIGMAYRELDEDRMLQAIAILEEGVTSCPEEVSLPRKLAETFLSYGWFVEAEENVNRIARLMPTSCDTYSWRLALARQLSRFDEARDLAAKISGCNAFSTAVLQEMKRANRYQDAVSEAERLANINPKSVSAKLEEATAAEALGDDDGALEAVEEALALSPLDSELRLSLADGMSVLGNSKQAMSMLDRTLEMPLAPRPMIFEAKAALNGEQLLRPYRIDGLDVIKGYRESNLGQEYDNSAVYVLDRAVYMVDEHGGIVMLIHMITHLKTDEAVEEHGELSVPGGARLLTARTIKADGRILEPEEVQGKESLSMPDLAPGDFVENEYILFSYPNQLFPGGFDTGRFYFQDFDTAFHRTEITLVVPEKISVEYDSRGNCPIVQEEKRDHKRVLTWRTRNAAPFPSEPLSPSANEFLPSIRVTSKASWEHLFRRIGDQLADKNRRSHVVEKAVGEALKGKKNADAETKRRAIYRWVMENIVPQQETFGQASHIIAERAGNRARAFAAMLRSAGLEARLVLVKSLGEDETTNALPSIQLFTHLLVEVEKGRLIDFTSEYAPYGFLQPIFRHRPMRYVATGALATTGSGNIPRDSQRVVLSLSLETDGTARGQIKETLSGILAAGWRSGLEKNHELEQERVFQGAYLSNVIPGAVLEKLDIVGLNQPDEPLELRYDVVIPDFARVQGKTLRMEMPFPTNLGKKAGGLATRETELVMGLHIEKQVDMSLTLPKGFSASVSSDKASPKDGSEKQSPWGTFSVYRKAHQGKLEVGYRTRVDVGRVSTGDYQLFLDFARHVDERSNIPVTVVSVSK